MLMKTKSSLFFIIVMTIKVDVNLSPLPLIDFNVFHETL
jgi:hypothetical protein